MITAKVMKYYVVTIDNQELTLTPSEYRELWNDLYNMPDPDDGLRKLERPAKVNPIITPNNQEYWPLTCGVETKEAEKYCVSNKLLTVDEPEPNKGHFVKPPVVGAGSHYTEDQLKEMVEKDETKIYVPASTETPEAEPEEDEPVVPEATKRVPVADLVPGVPAPKIKYKDDDFREYITLGSNGASRAAIVEKMVEEMNLTQPTAYRLYNKHVKNAIAYHKGVKERHDAISRIHREEIQSLPMYKSLKEFKNAVCERQHLNIYDVSTLKQVYLESHIGLGW